MHSAVSLISKESHIKIWKFFISDKKKYFKIFNLISGEKNNRKPEIFVQKTTHDR